MPRGQIGTYEKMGTDADGNEVWRVRVSVGSASRHQRVSKTIHGSRREAALLAAELRRCMGGSDIEDLGETLDEFFYSEWVPHQKAKGNANVTIHDSIVNFRASISPEHGARKLSDLTEQAVRELICDAGSPRNTHRNYRSILNYAYEKKKIPHRFDLQHLNYRHNKRQRVVPWDASEIVRAISAFRGEEMIELAFLIGCSGKRKEEILALRPCDLRYLKVSGNGTEETSKEVLAFDIRRAWTDLDGIKQPKTSDSNRLAPALLIVQDRIIELVKETRPQIERLGDHQYVIGIFNGYKKKMVAKYRLEMFEGSRSDAEKYAQSLWDPHSPHKGRPKLIRAEGTESFAIKMFDGYSTSVEKAYSYEPYEGAYSEACEYALSVWSKNRVIPCTGNRLSKRWAAAIEKHHLRHIPISCLRHTSETLMAAADVPSAITQKIHGHSTYKIDYASYTSPVLENLVEAADSMEAYLTSPAASRSVAVDQVDWR